jgi:hypothetical protein
MGRWTAQGWPVHGSTMDSTVADCRGSPELGLMAATACHDGGKAKVVMWRNRGNHSPELGWRRGGGAPMAVLRLEAATARVRMRRGGGEVKG